MIKTPVSETSLDFTACNAEKIHLIASVQAHGVFAAVSFTDLKIQMVSENFHQLTGGTDAKVLIGARLRDVLDEGLTKQIQERISAGVLRESKRHSFEWRGRSHHDVFLFKLSENLIGVELSPFHESEVIENEVAQPAEERLRIFVNEMKQAKNIAEIGKMACRAVRLLTGLDRVMLYRFVPPSWHGEVIAEDRSAQVHSFLNHKFPASDIPQPARDLYLRNQVRFIFDSSEEAFAIYPHQNPYSNGTIDLSDSRLRAVSKIHLEYLRNMNVCTSFSVAVVVDGKLWGLFAGHGSKKTYIPHSVRSICETLAHSVSLVIPMMEQLDTLRKELKFRDQVDHLFENLKSKPDPMAEFLVDLQPSLNLFNAQGAALITKESADVFGFTPTSKYLREIYSAFLNKMKTDRVTILASDRLSEVNAEWESFKSLASGALAILLPEMDDAMFVVFRPESVIHVLWGGDPRKTVDARNYQGKINPRTSFESWTETVKNRSTEWRPHETQGMKIFGNLLFDGLFAKMRLIHELRDRPSKP